MAASMADHRHFCQALTVNAVPTSRIVSNCVKHLSLKIVRYKSLPEPFYLFMSFLTRPFGKSGNIPP